MFKNVLKNTAVGLFARVISAIGSFLIIPLMLKQLGNNSYGIWMTISSAIGLMGFMDLGVGSTLMNHIAGASSDKVAIKKYINLAYIIQFAFIGLIIVAFITMFKFVNWHSLLNLKNSSSDTIHAIFVTGCLFFLSLVFNIIYSIERGLQRSDIANYWEIVSSILYILSISLVLVYSPTLMFVALVTFGIPVVVAVINSIWFLNRRKLFTLKVNSFNKAEAVSFISNSAGFFYLRLAGLIAFGTDTLIIAHVLNFEAVSAFSITAKLFSIPSIIISVYSLTLWPAYAKALASNNWVWIKKIFNRSIFACAAGVTAFVLIVFFLREPIFSLWLHTSLAIPLSLVVAFSTWTILNNVFDVHLAVLLNGLNKIKVQVVSALLMTSSNIVLSVFLAKKIGISGVVWGTIISTLCFSSIPMYIYARRLFRRNAYSVQI